MFQSKTLTSNLEHFFLPFLFCSKRLNVKRLVLCPPIYLLVTSLPFFHRRGKPGIHVKGLLTHKGNEDQFEMSTQRMKRA